MWKVLLSVAISVAYVITVAYVIVAATWMIVDHSMPKVCTHNAVSAYEGRTDIGC